MDNTPREIRTARLLTIIDPLTTPGEKLAQLLDQIGGVNRYREPWYAEATDEPTYSRTPGWDADE